MTPAAPLPAQRVLCRLADIPDGEARGFDPPPGSFIGVFAVRRGEGVFVFLNSCPHIGVPLEVLPHRFLDGRRERVVCAVHGARFRVEDGLCLSGPCMGDRLEIVPAEIRDGLVLIPEDTGR
ncbi:Rieske (2Fe-2S) protein [Roseomonas elaeocarpi]|uniref:Rieske (2Fe-2S) protein n=1 Tax=Roseomonas elaeocarpi TaxID=907779 RepID=A0ABV6JPN7_9PROT